ncbi:MAG: acyl-CoA thioesterase [Motiliproteus sp.]|jgi:acyl-CoA thioesterase
MTKAALAIDPSQQLAERCAELIYQQDATTRELGMKLIRIAPGSAELSMRVLPWMVNGHDTCHGGLIFSLADSTFAFACNSENYKTVAASCSIDYINPGHRNDLLIARASKNHQRGRTGVYDVQVENQQGELIALFRGRSHRLSGAVIPDTQKIN